MLVQCDHSIFNGDGCIVIYDGEECPLCVLEEKLRKIEETPNE